MIKILNNMSIRTLEVAGMYYAIRGIRNAKNSWDKSDTKCIMNTALIGKEDLKLAKTLVRAGSEHRKFLRQIQVWVDVYMPRYWWQEADTYKFGTKNSCSTMHKITSKPFFLNDFVTSKDSSYDFIYALEKVIVALNYLRERYLDTKDFKFILEIKRLLPESYLQLRTLNTNYEEILNMYHQRKHHRLKEEWVELFCGWCETLPYFQELCIDNKEDS